MLRGAVIGAVLLLLVWPIVGVRSSLPGSAILSRISSPTFTAYAATRHDASHPLHTMRVIKPLEAKHQVTDAGEEGDAPSGDGEPADNLPPVPVNGHSDKLDPVVQRKKPQGAGVDTSNFPRLQNSFEGMSAANSGCNCYPPDPNGAAGPNHYVEIVNTAFQIFSKAGVSLYGPATINTLWQGFGGTCETEADGDPVVLYDRMADRWLISEFTASSPYQECIAISQTPDPTGSYYRYAFTLSGSDFPDYPKIGVWPDGYYMSVNWFTGGTSGTWAGPRAYVFDRTAMLAGRAATFQTTAAPLGTSYNPMLPADTDSALPPPAGTPETFVSDSNTLDLYHFHVDWNTPANTTFASFSHLPIAGWTQLCSYTRSCVAQPGTSVGLDGVADRMLFRLAYRNFGDHESLVVDRTVDVGGGQAGVRWYEIRGVSTTPTLYQQGTYAPDTQNRWMGSVAMDGRGDLAIGYSVDDYEHYPSIGVAGRLATDSLGILPQGEINLFTGEGAQTGSGDRWGDYTDLTVDPSDDCTFWYVNEYYSATGTKSWQTRIASFRFPGCTSGPHLSVSVPSSVASGASFPLTVNATDAGGATMTGYTGTIHFSSTDGTAILPADYTFVPGDNGSHTFTVTLKAGGQQSVTAEDLQAPATSGSASLLVSPPAASLSLGTSTGTMNTSVSFSAGGFNAGEQVSLFWDSTSKAPTKTFTASSTGTIASNFTVPESPAGSHSVIIWGNTSGATATSTFTVQPLVTLGSTSGPQGSYVGVNVRGFAAAETVTVHWTGSTGSINVVSGKTNALGSINLGFNVPANPYGSYTVSVTGGTSGLNYTVGTPFQLTPALVLSTTSGSQGQSFTIRGTGFTAGEIVDLVWNCASNPCSGGTPLATSTTTDSSGNFPNVTVQVPSTATVGVYPIAGTGHTSGVVFRQNFTVQPTLSVSPSAAPPGATLTVSGTGYLPNDALKLIWNCSFYNCPTTTILSQSITTDGNGDFSGQQVTVPSSATTGGFWLGAQGTGTNADFARFLFTVQPLPASSLTITPSVRTSAPGTQFTVTVKALNTDGSVNSAYAGAIHFTSSDPNAVLPADYTFNTGDKGAHTFQVTLWAPGNETIGVSEKSPGTLTAGSTVAITKVVGSGWNGVSLPLSGGPGTAAALVSELNSSGQLGAGAVTEIGTFGNGQWQVYIPGYSQDFPLSPAQGVFFLNSGGTGQWTPSGTPFTLGQPISLAAGWDLVGAPFPYRGLSTTTIASEVRTCAVQEIAWASAGAPYSVWLPGQSGVTVPATDAIWIACNVAGTWTPS